MPTCRNEELKAVEAGIQTSYPRSCGMCKFGPCQKRVLVTGSMAKYATEVAPVEPKVENKYAVIYKDTIYHEGDERSRTHPGHGYPAYTETIDKIQIFKSQEELEDWILRNNTGFSRKTFTAIRYQELSVQTEVKVKLS